MPFSLVRLPRGVVLVVGVEASGLRLTFFARGAVTYVLTHRPRRNVPSN